MENINNETIEMREPAEKIEGLRYEPVETAGMTKREKKILREVVEILEVYSLENGLFFSPRIKSRLVVMLFMDALKDSECMDTLYGRLNDPAYCRRAYKREVAG